MEKSSNLTLISKAKSSRFLEDEGEKDGYEREVKKVDRPWNQKREIAKGEKGISALIPNLTIQENVMLPLAIVSSRNGEQKEMASRVLEKVGLAEKGRLLPNQLSGGEQERVAIARALVNNPAIILADEPTGNLDSKTGKEIMDLLKLLNSEGQTILMVAHNADNAKFAHGFIYLKDGKLQG